MRFADTSEEHLYPLYLVAVRRGEQRIREAGAYSLAVDYWTSLAKQKYLAISYYFAGPDCAVQSRLLYLVPVNGSATGVLTSQLIIERVEKHFERKRSLLGGKK